MGSVTLHHRWTPFFILLGIWIYVALRNPQPRESAAAQSAVEWEHRNDIHDHAEPPSTISDATESSTTFSDSQAEPSSAPPDPPARLLITYSYAESKTSRENLEYFIKHGLHNAADFIFVFNGPTNAIDLVPAEDNIRTIQRDNSCFDLGSAGEVLRQDDLWRRYSRFIIMNASARGPILPYWSDACWSAMLQSKVTEKVKLVGLAAKCWPRFHVSSMIWATDQIGLEILMDPTLGHTNSVSDVFGGPGDSVGLSSCYNTLEKALHAEVGATVVIQESGYEVDVLMTSFHNHHDDKAYCDSLSYDTVDPLRGSGLHPFDTMFMRPGNGMDPAFAGTVESWTADQNYSSYLRC
ncbi:hypothetical protein Cob_v010452 [Colletotrichum orbiculare MAFF 240422]|uniref:Uncharacterized protein n=1 Tax=Colletotrichum orbiculare (strain 104-T / ATCC 96160 / CBS 514.97 / LARS 414 / MAFF 240422) TaxID=1213857 RepID=N4UV89_COLOR|nr:hypothetical protein Cob_v010452 [Colletotrichum orbiculare MAFF 240422]